MPDLPGKLLPRNVAALRAGLDATRAAVQAAGNPASTLLQSGVGNCFPGLEFDMRNLERRFFPFLEVDTDFSTLQVTSVDRAGVDAAATAGQIPKATADAYHKLADSIGQPGRRWTIATLKGDFGPLGSLTVDVSTLDGASMGPGRMPADVWTAVRLLKEGATVTLSLLSPKGDKLQLAGPRMRYLDPNGALAAMFEVGELSQSLCSPWTHDFRDCGCYYWASNHPDIALPPATSPGPGGADQNLATSWLRADRTSPPQPAGATGGGAEVGHNAINHVWQSLNIVLERREQLAPYAEQPLVATPFADTATLLANLRFAAGVELALTQEYLTAAWSLRLAGGAPEPLRGDLRAAFFEVQQVAIGEMRHLRMVNEVLRKLSPPGAFAPALQVATQVPLGAGQWRALSFRALTPDVIAEFVAVEAPSQSVDSLYGRILATLEATADPPETAEAVRTIMAEGAEHWQTFLFVQEWLGRHAPADYLRATIAADAALPAHVTLQARYAALLQSLHDGYAQGLPAGAPAINAARAEMLGVNGIEGALEAIAATGALPRFDAIADPRFAPLQPPP